MFLIPVLDTWLLFAPLHGVTAVLNAAGAEELRRGEFSDADGELSELHRRITSTRVQVPGPLTGPFCPSMLGIITTRGCNIGCVYCNFGGPTANRQHMDPRIAVAAVDWMADRLCECGRKLLRVHFFGGEPLIAPEIVDIVVHRARYLCAERDLDSFFDASTNGVLSPSYCQFVGDYFDAIVLSFDGFRESHDRNRPTVNGHPTFDIVAKTARQLSAAPIDLCLRVCITQDNVQQMEDIVRWMCAEFQPVVVNFESLTPGELPTKAGLRAPNPYDFASNYLRAARAGRELGVRVVHAAAEIERNRISFCPVGTDALIVSLDGRASACYLRSRDWVQRGLDLDLGRFEIDGSADIDVDAVNRVRSLPTEKPACERCLCQWTCSGGCHVNHSFPGCPSEYDDFCIQTRIITACLLLEELGYEHVAVSLLEDRHAMERLAGHPWDTVAIDGCLSRDPSLVDSNSLELTEALVAEGIGIFG